MGDPDGGDDGASIAALGELAPDLPSDVSIRLVGQLDIDDLLALPPGAGAVVVDTATGVDPGWVVEIRSSGSPVERRRSRRSSVTLSRPETVGLASMIAASPDRVLVAIGGASFRPGEALSWPVSAGLGSFRVAIVDAIERVRTQVIADALPNAEAPITQGGSPRRTHRRPRVAAASAAPARRGASLPPRRNSSPKTVGRLSLALISIIAVAGAAVFAAIMLAQAPPTPTARST